MVHDVPEVSEADPKGRLKLRPYLHLQPSPSFHFNDGQHTPVNRDGVFSYTPVSGNQYSNFTEDISDSNVYSFQGKNVHWTRESFTAGADLSVGVLRGGFLKYGLGVSLVDEEWFLTHALGWGLGGTLGPVGLRFDGTIHIHRQDFQADMVKRDDGGSDPLDPLHQGWIYSKAGQRVYSSSLLRVTANTLHEFLGLNYSLSLESGSTFYFSNGQEFAGAALGWFKNLPKGTRVLNGVRMRKYLDLASSADVQFTYYAGMEFGFGN